MLDTSFVMKLAVVIFVGYVIFFVNVPKVKLVSTVMVAVHLVVVVVAAFVVNLAAVMVVVIVVSLLVVVVVKAVSVVDVVEVELQPFKNHKH